MRGAAARSRRGRPSSCPVHTGRQLGALLAVSAEPSALDAADLDVLGMLGEVTSERLAHAQSLHAQDRQNDVERAIFGALDEGSSSKGQTGGSCSPTRPPSGFWD